MSVKFEMNYSDFDVLDKNIKQLGNKAEKALNTSLHKHGKALIEPKITSLIPVSTRPGEGIRDKVHARRAKWSKEKKENLGLTITTKGGAANKRGSFGYLVFPNEGRGKHNPNAQNFMEEGRDQALPKLIEVIQEDLIQAIEEEL